MTGGFRKGLLTKLASEKQDSTTLLDALARCVYTARADSGAYMERLLSFWESGVWVHARWGCCVISPG